MLSTLLLVVIFAALLSLGFWLWRAGYFNKGEGEKGGASAADAPPKTAFYPDTIPEPEQKKMDLPKTFRHESAGFSFSYPEGFTVSRLPSAEGGGGETIVIQDTKRQAGFQIHLEPYDDPDTNITAERLERDISEMKVKDPQEVLIGSVGKGLAWVASDTGTREVWFIFGGTLYQLTAPLSNDTLLQRVLTTWRFE